MLEIWEDLQLPNHLHFIGDLTSLTANLSIWLLFPCSYLRSYCLDGQFRSEIKILKTIMFFSSRTQSGFADGNYLYGWRQIFYTFPLCRFSMWNLRWWQNRLYIRCHTRQSRNPDHQQVDVKDVILATRWKYAPCRISVAFPDMQSRPSRREEIEMRLYWRKLENRIGSIK